MTSKGTRTRRVAELEAENARLRRLLEEAGVDTTRAATAVAENAAAQEDSIAARRRNAAAASAMVRDAYSKAAHAAARHNREIAASEVALATSKDLNRELSRLNTELRMLMDELNHRIKNTLSMVQAIASQTLRDAASPTEASEAFALRLAALARAHDVLTRGNWSSTGLRDLVIGSVEPHDSEGRFRIRGPDIAVAAKPALAIVLVLHELCTNAIKYGALSNAAGFVEIPWRTREEPDGRHLELRWTEHQGPPVMLPTRKGFGSRLIERALAAEIGGTAVIAYLAAGVVCTIDAGPCAAENSSARSGW